MGQVSILPVLTDKNIILPAKLVYSFITCFIDSKNEYATIDRNMCLFSLDIPEGVYDTSIKLLEEQGYIELLHPASIGYPWQDIFLIKKKGGELI